MAEIFAFGSEDFDMTVEQLPLTAFDLDSVYVYTYTNQEILCSVDVAGATAWYHLTGYGYRSNPDNPQVLEFVIYDDNWENQVWLLDINYSYSDFEKLVSDGFDSPELLAGDDSIYGDDGNDVLTGFGGADLILGEIGDDIIYAGEGNDIANGEEGSDLLYGNQGDDFLYGSWGQDTLYGGQDEDYIEGNEGDDLIYGHKGNDIVYGGQDDDLLYGNQGNDYLYGNRGDDSIWAGKDDDWIDGGEGDDLLWGNKGADYFYLSAGNDVIYDFSSADGDFLVTESMSMLGYQQIGADLLVTHNEGSVLLTNTMFGIDFSESVDVILI